MLSFILYGVVTFGMQICKTHCTVNFNNQTNLIRSSSVNLVVVLTMDEQVKSTKGTVKLSWLADFKFTHGGV